MAPIIDYYYNFIFQQISETAMLLQHTVYSVWFGFFGGFLVKTKPLNSILVADWQKPNAPFP
jgi:hypothetical protein